MGECARNEASQEKLQTSPGLSLIGRAVKLFFKSGSVVRISTKASFQVWRVLSGYTFLQEELPIDSTTVWRWLSEELPYTVLVTNRVAITYIIVRFCMISELVSGSNTSYLRSVHSSAALAF
jgi:hypothetical protein